MKPFWGVSCFATQVLYIMAVIGFAAGGLPFLICFTLSLGRIIHLPDPHEIQFEGIHEFETDDHDELEPSQMLAYVHSPSKEECMIHHLSRNILTLTKDLISFAPRSKSPGTRPNTYERMDMLRSLKPDDVKNLLSQISVSVPASYNVSCPPGSQYYRTMDGSCNNLKNPCWGKADEPYQRWLPPAYANGVDEPRKKTKKGEPLPSPRQVYQWVSSQYEPGPDTSVPYLNNLAVAWGQMVAHDILLTPTVTVKIWNGKEFKDEKPHCCNTETPHPECIPIIMNYEDGYYKPGHCMDIVRSMAYMYSPHSCSPLKLGKTREQMNQITTFLDASFVYGSSEKHMRKLRENGGKGAKLIMEYEAGWSYPARINRTCKASSNACNKNCFLVGEKRANENPVLGALHTLWAREHNRLVDLLKPKGWPEETLFYVVRKIVGALLQHTTYKEYLTQIIGSSLSDLMKLGVPTKDYKYNPAINPTLYNVFVTAAFRFGHSMITSRHPRAGKRAEEGPLLSQDFFSVDDYCKPNHDPVPLILFGQLQQKSQKIDCIFSKQMTNHLFAKKTNGSGMDIFSLNIQRGRDHGLPPYNDWRESCGLQRARDYPDLRGLIPDYIIDRLEKIYGPGNVDEIDLYVGGIAEVPANDGILGPTFTCIVSNQFRNLKLGDRFWYENADHPGAFTPEQIATIQKTTISSLLCRNTDIPEMPRLGLLIESANNPRIPCSVIVDQTDINLNLW